MQMAADRLLKDGLFFNLKDLRKFAIKPFICRKIVI
jgi:hypothetical protein